jgi:hypothetical protein
MLYVQLPCEAQARVNPRKQQYARNGISDPAWNKEGWRGRSVGWLCHLVATNSVDEMY